VNEDQSELLAARLFEEYTEAAASSKIGGSAVLQRLGGIAAALASKAHTEQRAVAFVLSTVLSLHADDRDERIVTGDDNYHLMALGSDALSEAVHFLVSGGNAKQAIGIICRLAELTPDAIFGR
jgi:hypothetical protein